MTDNRLYRLEHGKLLGGVAMGLADYFAMDPSLVRLIFVLLTIFGGAGVPIYLVMWIIVPVKRVNTYKQPTGAPAEAPFSDYSGVGETYSGFNESPGAAPYSPAVADETTKRRRLEGSLIGGLVLIAIGGMFLMERFIPVFDFGNMWPVVLIVVGMAIIAGSKNRFRQAPPADGENTLPQVYKSENDNETNPYR